MPSSTRQSALHFPVQTHMSITVKNLRLSSDRVQTHMSIAVKTVFGSCKIENAVL